MKNWVLLILFLLVGTFVFSQNKEIDRLEMLYAQGHYKMVYNGANRLLNSPDYDFSAFPSYYKALSILQLAQRKRNFSKKKYDINLAGDLLKKVRENPNTKSIFIAHADELASLKKDLMAWTEDVNLKGNKQLHDKLVEFIATNFGNIDDLPTSEPNLDIEDKISKDISKQRQDIISYAKKFIGTPYVYGGTKPSGFDCSGYVGYVMDEEKIDLPRRSMDQYSSSKKLKENAISPGDLVFFSNGGDVTHVGIIYAVEKDGIYMIHASSGKGVTITNITTSKYWNSRIKGFGTYLR